MKLLAKILGFALATAATFAAFGAAASLTLGTKLLSAGSATVTSCGAASISATRNVNNAGNVTQVNVGGISAACSGETLSVTLVGTAGASLGSASGTLTGCTTTCSATFSSFGATVSAAALTGYSFGVVGS